MTPARTKALLEEVAAGNKSAEQALQELRALPFDDLGFARVDLHRPMRNGVSETVYGEGKTAAQINEIGRSLLEAGQHLLVTRLDEGKAAELVTGLPGFQYDATARLGRCMAEGVEQPRLPGSVAVLSAGTSDMAVAEEAAQTLEFLGAEVLRFADVGVAGLHRLLESRERVGSATVALVVAGMEGALPSVVGGLIDLPLIAVPTSVGYGASFGGLAALLGMLNSCSAGVTVVNIDNGFGAATAAAAILRATTGDRGQLPSSESTAR